MLIAFKVSVENGLTVPIDFYVRERRGGAGIEKGGGNKKPDWEGREGGRKDEVGRERARGSETEKE